MKPTSDAKVIFISTGVGLQNCRELYIMAVQKKLTVILSGHSMHQKFGNFLNRAKGFNVLYESMKMIATY